MKRLLSIIAVAAMVLGNVSLGYAGNPETVNIAITIKHTKSITVSPATLDIKPGETKTTSATVENDGTGIDETVKMTKLEGVPSGFTIKFQFTDTSEEPNNGWKDYPTDEVFKEIAHGETKYLWVKLAVPNPTTVVAPNISVTLTAE